MTIHHGRGVKDDGRALDPGEIFAEVIASGEHEIIKTADRAFESRCKPTLKVEGFQAATGSNKRGAAVIGLRFIFPERSGTEDIVIVCLCGNVLALRHAIAELAN